MVTGRQRRLAVALLLTALATACGGAVDEASPTPAPSTGSETPAPSPTGSEPAPSPTDATPAPSPTETSRDETPTTTGEALVLYRADRDDPYEAGETRLLLVAADGTVTTVVTWPPEEGPWAVLDWSPDGARAIVSDADPVTHRHRLWLVDVATGELELLTSSPELEWLDAAFTQPTGRNVVVLRATDERVRLQRLSEDGEVLATLSDGPPGADWPGLEWLYGLDGTTVVLGGDDHGLRVVGTDGALRTRLDDPSTCAPVRWWSADTVLARCRTGAPELHYGQLWLVPADGRAATPLTAGPPPDTPNVDFGHVDAARLGDTTILQWAGDCGSGQIRRLEPDGSVTPLRITTGHGVFLVGVARDRLLLHATTECDPRGALVSATLDGGDVRVLVPQEPGEIGVVSAVSLGRP